MANRRIETAKKKLEVVNLDWEGEIERRIEAIHRRIVRDRLVVVTFFVLTVAGLVALAVKATWG